LAGNNVSEMTCFVSGGASEHQSASALRRVGLKDVLKVINDVTCSTSRLVSSSTATVSLPLQQTVAVCTLLLMTQDSCSHQRAVVNHQVTLGKVTQNLSALSRSTSRGKRSPYSITERRVPELILVLGSQPAGDMSHKHGGRLPLLSARPAVALATLTRAATNVTT